MYVGTGMLVSDSVRHLSYVIWTPLSSEAFVKGDSVGRLQILRDKGVFIWINSNESSFRILIGAKQEYGTLIL